MAETGRCGWAVAVVFVLASTTASRADYTLTVNSGSGSGSGNRPAGNVVAIYADPAPSGCVFDRWIGDTATITHTSAYRTTMTIPAADVEITAAYTDAPLYGIFAWGRDWYTEVSDPPIGLRFVAVAGGYGHSVALCGDGSIVSWGGR